MHRRLVQIALVAAALSAALAAQSPRPATGAAGAPSAPLLVNERTPLPGVLTGGVSVESEGFGALAAAGYRTFVDLRSDGEIAAGTRDRAVAAGLDYVRIPVSGEAELDLPTVRALDGVLDDDSRLPAVVACASGNRSGALLALRARWLDGAPPDEALELGEKAGLTRLEPSVRILLGLSEAPAPDGVPATLDRRTNSD